MCVSPINIVNPYRGTKSQYHDTISSYIQVPCGVCCECVKNKQLEFVHSLQFYQYFKNDFLFFFTLTYNDESLPIYYFENTIHFDDGSTLDSMPCINYRHIQELKMRFRNDFVKLYPNIPIPQWVTCAEYGSKLHRPHYHGILFVDNSFFVDNYRRKDTAKIQSFEQWFTNWLLEHWAFNIAPRRFKPVYVQRLTPKRQRTTQGVRGTYDCHHVTQDSTDVLFYVTKYILKYDKWYQNLKLKLYYHSDLPREDFYKWNSECRPRVLKFQKTIEQCLPFVDNYLSECHARIMESKPITLPHGGAISSTLFEKKILPLVVDKFGLSIMDVYNLRVKQGVYKCKDSELVNNSDTIHNYYIDVADKSQKVDKFNTMCSHLLQATDLPKELL